VPPQEVCSCLPRRSVCFNLNAAYCQSQSSQEIAEAQSQSDGELQGVYRGVVFVVVFCPFIFQSAVAYFAV
jgi:hypothetical protein